MGWSWWLLVLAAVTVLLVARDIRVTRRQADAAWAEFVRVHGLEDRENLP
jgi:hypothetical protein